MLPQFRRFAACLSLIGFVALAAPTNAQTTVYPFFKEVDAASKVSRIAELEQSLGIAASTSKINAASDIAQGYLYKNPKTQTWDKAMAAGEYLHLSGNLYGAYYLALLVTDPAAPYPDYGTRRRMLEACASSSDRWLINASNGLLGDVYRYSYGMPQDYAKAMALYQLAAETGNANAAQALAYMYANGYAGGQPRFDQALVWYRKAKEIGVAADRLPALEKLIQDLESGAYAVLLPDKPSVPAEFDVAEWHRKAETGNAIAAAELATIYGRGLGGVFYSKIVSKYWLARAAAGGIVIDAEGLENGTAECWKALAEAGSPLGKGLHAYNVGYADEAARAEYLRLCDEVIAAGYPRGEYRKAFAFYDKTDMSQALSLLERSSARGYFFADDELALLYYNGTYLDPDYSKAVHYARRALQRPNSQNVLGLCYLEGKGVEKDQAKAVECFEYAADLGDSSFPLYNLARCYANGWGVEKNVALARELAAESKEAGNPSAASLIAEIDAGKYTPRTPPTVGTAYLAKPQYDSQLPAYADFAIDGVATLYRIFDYKGNARAFARVKNGPHYFDAILECASPAAPEPKWTLVSVIPEMTNATFEIAGEVFLAQKESAGFSGVVLYRSVGDDAWSETSSPVPFTTIVSTGTSFVGVSSNKSIYLSNDGLNWQLATEGLKLGSYFAPMEVGAVTAAHGWIFVTPTFGYAAGSSDTGPLLASQDGKAWKTVGNVEKSDGYLPSKATLFVSSDFATLSVDSGRDTGNRLFVFRNGALESETTIEQSKVIAQAFDVDGHAFAISPPVGTYTAARLLHTGHLSASAVGRPEEVAPTFIDLGNLYRGQALPYSPSLGAMINGNLLLPTSYRSGHYFFIGGFRVKPVKTGDFARLAGNALKPISDRPPVKLAKFDAETKARIEELQRKADSGDAASEAELGKGLVFGHPDILKNEYLGLSYLESAAAKKNADANETLGSYWVFRDAKRAETHFKTAAELGDQSATYLYAQYLDSGNFSQDRKPETERAIGVVKRLSESGDTGAAQVVEFLGYELQLQSGYNVAAYRGILRLYESGARTPHWSGTITRDEAKAALAENGDQTILVELFESARQANNETLMKQWLAKLVEFNNPVGLYYDALATYQGSLGRTKDETAGVAKIEQAAAAGSAQAIREVVAFHARGLHGRARDLAKAKEWALKGKAAGDAEWADAYILTLDAELKSGEGKRPVDTKVSGLSAKVMDQLSNIQNSDAITSFGKDRVGFLFSAIWWDADISKDEEDLVRELLTGMALTITGEDGTTLSFTKSPPAADHATWQTVFPDPFPLSDANYPLTSWGYAATPGPTVYFLRNPATRDAVRQTLAQAIYGELSKRVQAAEQSRNVGHVTEFATMLLSRAKGGDSSSGIEFAALMYSIIKDDIKANANLLPYFSSLNSYATSTQQ